MSYYVDSFNITVFCVCGCRFSGTEVHFSTDSQSEVPTVGSSGVITEDDDLYYYYYSSNSREGVGEEIFSREEKELHCCHPKSCRNSSVCLVPV